jgi:hypothetical protein
MNPCESMIVTVRLMSRNVRRGQDGVEPVDPIRRRELSLFKPRSLATPDYW